MIPSKGVDYETLLAALEEEERDAAFYYDSELAKEQAENMDRYHARPYGNEEPGRSKVVTHDVEDTFNWVAPHLMRLFSNSDDLIGCDADTLEDDDQSLTDAASLLRHILFKDNNGEAIIHDYLFDGFIQKVGVLRSVWEMPDPCPPEVLEGLTSDQVEAYSNDRSYQILAGQVDGEIDVEMPEPEALPQPMPPAGLLTGPPQALGLMPQQRPAPIPLMPMTEPTFSLLVQKVPRGKVHIETVPPENFRISRRAKSIETANYHGMIMDEYLTDLIRQYPQKRYELDPDGSVPGTTDIGIDREGDERVQARFPDEPYVSLGTTTDIERRKVETKIEYIRGDYDRDGVVELRRIKRCGSVILEDTVESESEFEAWSPIRVSHRAVGRAVADTLRDIQAVRTALTRRAMDSMSQSLSPRSAVDVTGDEDGQMLMDILDHQAGGVVRVKGDPNRKIMPLLTPDVSGSAFQAIEYWDRRSEEASGVNRHAMGIQPQAITDTKGGIENLQAAANARVEQYARWAALGLERMLSRALRLVIKHQDHARIIKINGRKLKVDPRRWVSDMVVSVHVGMAAETREKKLTYLNLIKQTQEQILTTAGPSNPIVSLKQYRHTLAQLVQTMGYKSAAPFFGEVPDNWQPPEPSKDPKLAEVEGKLQMQQAEAQQKAQLQAAEMQHKAQLEQVKAQTQAQADAAKLEMDRQRAEAELISKQQLAEIQTQAEQQRADRQAEHERVLAEIKIKADTELAVMKAQTERELAEMRIAAETELAAERMAAEMAMARWKASQELRIRRETAAADNDDDNGDGPSLPAFRAGGSLSA